MSCKACDAQLSGAQFDVGLCGRCREVSDFYLEIAKDQNENQEGSRAAKPSTQRFEAFVKKHNLRESWADGIGLVPEHVRVVHMEEKAWSAYCQYLSWGIGHEKALRRATGQSGRSNNKYAMAGEQVAQGMDGAAATNSPMEDYMGQESHHWEHMWRDDL